jgi:arabinan endo-1,5-alpha-L-arabinosidase
MLGLGLLSSLLETRLWAQALPPVKEGDPVASWSRGVRSHDPSTIVRCKEKYWVFYTGVGIPSYYSTDLVKWEAGPRVFTNAPAWVADAVPENRRTHFWAPDVIHAGGRYLLYYSVSSFGKNTSAIGLATNATLDPADANYAWVDQGIVIRSLASDNFNAIDPAVLADAERGLWLSFGSFWSGIQLIPLDPTSGRRLDPGTPPLALAHYSSIEAPYIYRHADYYYLFVNWGICCRGTNSTYNIRVGRSRSVAGPYVDDRGADLLQGGGRLVLESVGSFIGPGHAGIVSEGGTNWLSCHFYDGNRSGASTLAILPLTWTSEGWPQVKHSPHIAQSRKP